MFSRTRPDNLKELQVTLPAVQRHPKVVFDLSAFEQFLRDRTPPPQEAAASAFETPGGLSRDSNLLTDTALDTNMKKKWRRCPIVWND